MFNVLQKYARLGYFFIYSIQGNGSSYIYITEFLNFSNDRNKYMTSWDEQNELQPCASRCLFALISQLQKPRKSRSIQFDSIAEINSLSAFDHFSSFQQERYEISIAVIWGSILTELCELILYAIWLQMVLFSNSSCFVGVKT